MAVSLTGRTSVGIAPENTALATDDTAIRVEARGNRLVLTGLRCPQTNGDWISPENRRDDDLPAIPFIETAQVEGHTVSLAWRYVGSRTLEGLPRRCVLTFACANPPLELKSLWLARSGPGPIEHTLTVTNRGEAPVTLPLQPSLTFAVRPPANHLLEHWWLDKPGATPTEGGVHHQRLTPDFAVSLVARPAPPDNRLENNAIPWTALQDVEGQQGWYAGVEFSGPIRITLKAGYRAAGSGDRGKPPESNTHQGAASSPATRNPLPAARYPVLHVSLGLAEEANTPTPYRTRLAPGETFEAPAVFLGCYRGDVDDGANRLRRWVDANLRPTTRETRWPFLIGSSGHDVQIDGRQARKQIAEVSALGLEAFLLDARWFREVGDWRLDPEKFPDGLAALADDARAQGVKFGLEADWTQGGNRNSAAGTDLVLSVFDSGQQFWFPRRYPPDWKPGAFTGATVCLGEQKAEEWGLKALRRLLHDHRLDLLAQDGPLLVENCDQETHRHTDAPTDVTYQAARGLYRIQDALREPNPGLLLVNGGSLLDYGLVRRTHALRLTEARSPLAVRRAFYDASYAFPPALCAGSITIPPDSDLPRFLYALRSGLLGQCILPGDFTQWNGEQRNAARRQFAIYKTWLRPLITNGDLYHLTERPDGVRWDGIEYADPKTGKAALFAFHGTTPQASYTFHLRGLDPASLYQVTFEDGTDPPLARTGEDLMKNGVTVRLAERESSELVYLQAPRL
jgi:hypothetical protein